MFWSRIVKLGFHLDGVLVVSVAVPSELADLPLPGDDELVAGPFNRDHQGHELRTFELSENKTCVSKSVNCRTNFWLECIFIVAHFQLGKFRFCILYSSINHLLGIGCAYNDF